MNERGQLKLSFGMIFSIILIIIFLAFAFFAVKKFIGIGNAAQIIKFKNDLQSDIDNLWRGSQGSEEHEYFLPSKIKYVCFADYNYTGGARGVNQEFYDGLQLGFHGTENLFFYPLGSADEMGSSKIKHIDLAKITESANPFCIKTISGKLRLTLKKNYGDVLVTITS